MEINFGSLKFKVSGYLGKYAQKAVGNLAVLFRKQYKALRMSVFTLVLSQQSGELKRIYLFIYYIFIIYIYHIFVIYIFLDIYIYQENKCGGQHF